MAELEAILMGILVLVHGIVFYIAGRINLLEKFILKFNKMLEDATKTDEDERKEDEK